MVSEKMTHISTGFQAKQTTMNDLFFLPIMLMLMSALPSSCRKDTCNQAATFRKMTAADTIQLTDGVFPLEIRFSTDQRMPVEYYRAASISQARVDLYGTPWENDYSLLQGFSADTLTLILHLIADALPEGQRAAAFHLIFPDRSAYISCSHPGGPDKYYLDLQCTLTRTKEICAVQNFTWKETRSKGPF
jgi:hypothetical protein